MTVNRRELLKGVALGGMSGLALGGSLPTLAAVSSASGYSHRFPAMLMLVNNTTAHTPFLEAAQQAAQQVSLQANPAGVQIQKISTELSQLQAFERRLRTGQPLRVIGLLDDASATLVLDLARSAGARTRWLGQHSTAAGMTSHRLLNVDNSEQYSRQLSREAGQWMGQLGHYLASSSPLPPTLSPLIATASMPVTGSFVSFSIEV